MIYKGLKQIKLKRFKAFDDMSEAIELSPITVLVGENSSGKTSIIQSLLLLKQTLQSMPKTLALKIDSPYVDFSHLCEATYGWPGWRKENMPEKIEKGPRFTLTWETETSLKEARSTSGPPVGIHQIAKFSQMAWLNNGEENTSLLLNTQMNITFGWNNKEVIIKEISLISRINDKPGPEIFINHITEKESVKYKLRIPGQSKPKEIDPDGIILTYDHFIPSLQPQMRIPENIRILTQVFWIFFRLPLDGLRKDIESLHYLGPLRAKPRRHYQHTGSATQGSMDPGGESAAEILAQEKAKPTHYAPFVKIESIEKNAEYRQTVKLPSAIEAQPLKEALNYFLENLGFHELLDTEEQWGTSYRVTANEKSTIVDVGFGVSQILPVIIAGLRSDWAFGESKHFDSLDDYNSQASCSDLIILEQPEIHLHPKAQSRLAQFLVSMALSGRRIIIETHSDHLIRRLRGLIARTYDVQDEERLRKLINIVNFTYKKTGTQITQIMIDKHGKFVEWPEDFMDEAANEEEDIFMAWTRKE